MKQKWLTALVVMLVVAATLPAGGAKAADEAALLGVSVPTLDDPFYEDMVAGAQAMADEMEMTLVVMSAENDVETELENVQELLDEGVSALLYSPVDIDENADILALVYEANVPIILMVEEPSETAWKLGVDGVVMPDEWLIGQRAGELMCDALDGEGVVVEVINGQDQGVALDRALGFSDYMNEECTDVTLTPFDVLGREDRDAFIEAFSAWLKEESLDGVLVLAQDMTLPALEAAIAARVTDLTFVAFDNSEEAMSALQQGRLQWVVVPSGWLVGQNAVEMASTLLNGEELDPMVVQVEPDVWTTGMILRGGPRSGRLE